MTTTTVYSYLRARRRLDVNLTRINSLRRPLSLNIQLIYFAAEGLLHAVSACYRAGLRGMPVAENLVAYRPGRMML